MRRWINKITDDVIERGDGETVLLMLVMTPARQAEAVVADSHRAGIRKIWLYRATGEGAVNEATLQFCAQNGMDVVAGYCPYMFLPGVPWFHRLHGALLKITGRYPA